MTLQSAFENFILTKESENRTEKTISNYRDILSRMVSYFRPDILLDDISLDMVKGYFVTFSDRGLSPASVACYVRHCKAFFAYIEKMYGLPFKSSDITVPRYQRRAFHIFSPDEIALIFKSVSCSSEWLTLRNRLIIALMLDSGLRRSDVLSLRWSWISIEQRKAKVYGKGRKERYIPLGGFTIKLLLTYRTRCPFSDDTLFYTVDGRPLNSNAIKLFFSKLAKKLPFSFNPHLLRHNFATNWCLDQYREKGSIDIYALKSLMGHSSIDVTMVYLHYAEDILACQHSISHLDTIGFKIA